MTSTIIFNDIITTKTISFETKEETSSIHLHSEKINYNDTNATSTNLIHEVRREITPFEIATAIVCVFAILVNICVLLVIYIGPRAFRTPTFFFISSLASADMLSGAAVLCAMFVPVGDGVWERIVLKGAAVVSFSASVNNLVVIAFDRYLKIHNEQKYNKIFTHCHAALFITLSWATAIALFLIAPLVGWSCDGKCVCLTDCMCDCERDSCSQSFTPFTKSYLIVGVGYFYLSLAVMAILYILLFSSVKRRSGRRRKRSGSVKGQMPNRCPFVMIHRRREIWLAKTLVIVMSIFFICWLPVTTLFIVDVFMDVPGLIKWFDYCLISAVVHPLINPVIYSMRLPRMWCTFKHLSFALWRRIFWKKPIIRASSRQYNSYVVPKQESGISSLYSHPNLSRSSSGYHDKISPVCAQVSNSNQEKSGLVEETETFPINIERSNSKNSSQIVSSKTDTDKKEVERPSLKTRYKSSYVTKENGFKEKGQSPFNSVGRRGSGKTKFGHRRPRSSIVLSSGTVVAREDVQISLPFNPENKLTWS